MSITPVQHSPQWTASTARAVRTKEETAAELRVSQDTVELSGGGAGTPVTYTPPKKLGNDQIQALKEQQAQQERAMLQAMADETINQTNSWLKSKGYDMSRFQLPPLAMDPAGAKAAIAPGGAYSVDAVATRIFDMASAIAGDDPAMLATMREAVEKGFQAAGTSFAGIMGDQGLPDICNETYREIMDRFDKRAAELSGTAANRTETAE